MELYPYYRAIQSQFPALLSLKTYLQRTSRQIRKRPFEVDFELLARLKVVPGECALDVGANRGQSIDAIRLYLPDIEINSFEPSESLADRLRTRAVRDKALHVHQFGLSNEESEFPLFLPVYRGFPYDGLASFDRSEAESWLGPDTVAWFDPKRLEIREMICKTRRLDSFSLNPALLKIDVQGFEAEVLKGGVETLRASKPLILLENNPKADEWLMGEGWTRFAYKDGVTHESEMGEGNTFYVHGALSTRLTG